MHMLYIVLLVSCTFPILVFSFWVFFVCIFLDVIGLNDIISLFSLDVPPVWWVSYLTPKKDLVLIIVLLYRHIAVSMISVDPSVGFT